MIQDPYGNYAIQEVIDNWEETRFEADFCSPILSQISGSVVFLAVQKHSSNVIEKILEKGNKSAKNSIAEELLQSADFVSIMNNCYGNYVIQKALAISYGDLLY